MSNPIFWENIKNILHNLTTMNLQVSFNDILNYSSENNI